MRMKYFSTLLAALAVFSTSKAQYNIEFKINGLNKGQECILAHYYADQNKIVDTSEVNAAGKVVFKGASRLLNGVYIIVLPGHSYIEFVVPNDDQEFSIAFDTSLSAASKIATGSADNEAFFAFDKFAATKGLIMRDLREKFSAEKDEKLKEDLRKQIGQIDKEVDLMRRELIELYPNTFTAKLFRAVLDVEMPKYLDGDTTGKRFEYYRAHYWDNIDISDDGILRTPMFKGKLEYYMTKLHVQHPDSVIPPIDALTSRMERSGARELFKYTVWWNTNHYEESKLMCMDKVLHHMAKNYYCAGRAFWADTSLVNKMCEHSGKIGPTLCGQIAPDMVLVDSTFVREYQLHKIAQPVTVLVFWDHQCGHCKKELPKLKEMYDTMKARGVEVYAVYTQGDWEGWRKYIRENNLNWINVMDAFNKATFRKDYNIISTPLLYLLDHNKQIMYKNPPAENAGLIVDLMLKQYQEEMKKNGAQKP